VKNAVKTTVKTSEFFRRRVFMGISRKTLSQLTQISTSTLANIEQGICFPSYKQLSLLSNVYGISKTQLVDCEQFKCEDCGIELNWPIDIIYEKADRYLCSNCKRLGREKNFYLKGGKK